MLPMKKIIVICILVLVIGGIYYKFFYNNSEPALVINQEVPLDQQEELCKLSGGAMKTFPNTCADTCAAVKEGPNVVCGEMLTRSCDCGPDTCWAGSECAPNPK